MSCPNYDKSKGEQIALNVDGSLSSHKTDEEITYGRGIMDRITLSSQKSVKDPSRYAVGIFNGSELHLTPLKGIGKYLSLCAIVPGRVSAFSTDTRPEIMRVSVLICGYQTRH